MTEASAEQIAAAERTEACAWSSVWDAAPERVRVALGLSYEQRGSLAILRAARSPLWLFNRVIGLGLDEEATRESLASMAEGYARAGASYGVCLVDTARPAALPSWLAEMGLSRTTTLARMLRTTDALPGTGGVARIRAVGRQESAIFGRTAARGFGLPDVYAEWFAGLCGRDGWRTYLAYDAGVPVATGALYVHGRVGWIGFGATVQGHRGRGIHRAMLARRMADAADLGCRSLQTETNLPHGDAPTPSLDNMKRLGFRMAYARPNYVFTPLSA